MPLGDQNLHNALSDQATKRNDYMGYDPRKPAFGGLRTQQGQTSLRIRAVWSAPLLLAFWKVPYVNLLLVKF